MKKPPSRFQKLRACGIKGAISYILSQHRQKCHLKSLKRNAKSFPLTPKHGITLIGRFSDGDSISKVCVDLIVKLKAAGIPCQTFDLNGNVPCFRKDISSLLTPSQDFRILKYDTVIGWFPSGILDDIPIRRARIVFWEFESGLIEHDPALNDGCEIIGMSDFNVNVYKTLFPNSVKIHKILYPFYFENCKLTPPAVLRKKYGIGEKDFAVFYNFSFNSSYHRKNPYGALKAFALAFQNTQNAKLIFKTCASEGHPDKVTELKQIADTLGCANKCITIPSFLSQEEIYSLTNACDVYLSLHRGEGFGLGIAEAMSLGKPVVVTDYSGPKEFCTPENSFTIPYKIVPVQDDQIDNMSYRFVKEWADPDIDAAAQALLSLYQSPELRTRLGSAARAFIVNHFSTGNFRKSVEAFLAKRTSAK